MSLSFGAMNRTWTYLSGEPIMIGDVIKLGSWNGTVVDVITEGSPGWVDCIGEGIAIEGPAFGRIHTEFIDEDLIFCQRAAT